MFFSNFQTKLRTAPTLFFDLDGTLLCTTAYWRRLPLLFIEKENIRPDPEDIRFLEACSFQEAAQYIQGKWFPQLEEAELRSLMRTELLHFYEHEATLIPGSEAFLRRALAEGKKLIAITDNHRDLILPALERNGIADCFHRIYFGPDHGTDKSSPKLFRLALEDCGAFPEHCLFFDDSAAALRTAKQLGFYTVGLLYCKNPGGISETEAYCDHTLEDYTKLT